MALRYFAGPEAYLALEDIDTTETCTNAPIEDLPTVCYYTVI